VHFPYSFPQPQRIADALPPSGCLLDAAELADGELLSYNYEELSRKRLGNKAGYSRSPKEITISCVLWIN
jgi:hypothetical protein